MLPGMENILSAYGIQPGSEVETFGCGLINDTWLVKDKSELYILQKINAHVFREPGLIAINIDAIASYLLDKHPDYFFVAPLRTIKGVSLFHVPEDGAYRLFPFVKDSVCYQIAETPDLAYEAARQFGKFTSMLARFPEKTLHLTLPGFHDLPRRFEAFDQATQQGDDFRIRQSQEEIIFLRSKEHLVTLFREFISSPDVSLRVTHHDTKISNVLFNKKNEGICVIDLDTVMPGHFISDVGDMFRTYLSAVSEEEQDLSKVRVREAYFTAIIKGYYAEMSGELTPFETAHFFEAGLFMIYMQALRFLTDHLLMDRYYGSAYEGHNLQRARNQIQLLKSYLDYASIFRDIVATVTGANSSRPLLP